MKNRVFNFLLTLLIVLSNTFALVNVAHAEETKTNRLEFFVKSYTSNPAEITDLSFVDGSIISYDLLSDQAEVSYKINEEYTYGPNHVQMINTSTFKNNFEVTADDQYQLFHREGAKHKQLGYNIVYIPVLVSSEEELVLKH